MLGKAVAQTLAAREIPVVATTHDEVDICNPEACKQMIEQGPFTHIINCAAYTQVDDSEENPDKAICLNTEAPRILASLARDWDARLIHFSTDYVFDGMSSSPYSEEETTHPLNVYGRSKADGEAVIRSLYPKSCIVRTSSLFGPGGGNFVLTMLDLMERQEVIEVVDDQISRPTYTLDLAQLLPEIIDCEGTYHFANAGEASWYAFALFIRDKAEQIGWKFRVQELRPIKSCRFLRSAERPKYSVLSTQKVEDMTGLHPRDWRVAVSEYLQSRSL